MSDILRIDELKEILRENGLRVSGNKDDLLDRLEEFDYNGSVQREWIARKYGGMYKSQNERLKKDNEELKEENEELKREKRKLQQSNNKLQREVDQLKQEHKKKDRSVATYEQVSMVWSKQQVSNKNSSFARSIAGPSGGTSSSFCSLAPPKRKKLEHFSEFQLHYLETELDRKRPLTKDVVNDLAFKTKLDYKQVHGWLATRTKQSIQVDRLSRYKDNSSAEESSDEDD